MRKKIAVTGGIGSGKSLALRYIAQMGYPIFSCDEIYKDVIQSPQYIQQIALLFPDVIVDGYISRARLAKLVFDNPINRTKINEAAHPLIMANLYAQMGQCECDLVFAEAPLLFEGKFEKNFDQIIYIYRDKTARINDVMSRDGLSLEEVEKRMAVQFDPDSIDGKKRLMKNDVVVIQNNDSVEVLYQKLSDCLQDMKQ